MWDWGHLQQSGRPLLAKELAPHHDGQHKDQQCCQCSTRHLKCQPRALKIDKWLRSLFQGQKNSTQANSVFSLLINLFWEIDVDHCFQIYHLDKLLQIDIPNNFFGNWLFFAIFVNSFQTIFLGQIVVLDTFFLQIVTIVLATSPFRWFSYQLCKS